MDPMLAIALLVSVGLAVVFYVKWRRAVDALQPLSNECDQQRKRAWKAEGELAATRAALAGKVAAEFSGGDGEGPVAA